MKWLLASLAMGASACAHTNNSMVRLDELRQNSNSTILIENWRWEPIIFHISAGTQFDSLGIVGPRGEKKCFEIKQRQKVIVSFAYENVIYQTPPFNPEYGARGHHLVIGHDPSEDVMSIEPSMRCDADGNYVIF